MINTLLLIFLILLLLLAFVGDLLQYAVRIIISIMGQPNLATHLVSLSMLINRFGAALGLLLIGYLIDTGISARDLLICYILFSVLLAIVYFGAAKTAHLSPVLLGPIIRQYYKIEVPRTLYARIEFNGVRPKLDFIIVFVVALLGFMLPSVAAAAIPEFRATLLQCGFILNSFATLYLTLKIEKQLALTLQFGTNNEKWAAYLHFMYSRAISSCLACGLFTSVLVFYVCAS